MPDEEKDLPDGEEQTEEQKKDKITKKYLAIMKVVSTVVGGEGNLKPKKVIKGDVTARVVAKLFKQEKEELEQKASEGLKELLKKHVECQAEIAKKKKELDDLELKKKKEFTEAANKWVQIIDRGEVMTSQYANALKAAFEKEDEKK